MKSSPPKNRLSSGVDGLDLILKGGFLLPPSDKKDISGHGLVLLIRGKPGSGKTTLALQILKASLQWDDIEGDSAFYTLDQPRQDILCKLGSLGVNTQAQKKILIQSFDGPDKNYASSETPITDVAYPIEATYIIHRDLIERKSNGGRPRIAVIDGLNCLESIDRNESLELTSLIQLLREVSTISILVYEPLKNENSPVQYLVDMTIDLKAEVEVGSIDYFFHRLCISKSRYQDSVLGWHKYKIRDNGIEIHPSIHFYIHRQNHITDQYERSLISLKKHHEDNRYTEIGGITGLIEKKNPKINEDKLEEIREESIIARILGHIKRGSSTVLFGARRTSKSQLTMDFLRAGGRKEKKKHGLLLSLIDNQHTIIQETSCQRQSCKNFIEKGECCRACFENVYLYHLRPGCISPEEFFYNLKKRLEQAKSDDGTTNIRRLVFWDLTQLEFRFPLLSQDPMFLPALMDFLKQYKDTQTRTGISSLFMSAANTKLSAAASAMADNVIFCWRDEFLEDGENKKKFNTFIETIKDEQLKKAYKNFLLKDFLILYVDRAEGVVQTTKRQLYCFPIDYKFSPINDFAADVRPYKTDCIDWLKRAPKEIMRIDQLQGVPR